MLRKILLTFLVGVGAGAILEQGYGLAAIMYSVIGVLLLDW